MSDTERMLSLALIHAASDPKVTREALEEIQGLAKDPQRLRALLESEGLGEEEGDGDEEEEPDPEDVPIGKRYRGSLRPADLIIGKRYRPTVAKAATVNPLTVEPDEDTGPALARWYAGWFEALEASGLEVSESDLAAAEDELDGTGWCVGRDDDGEWEARATRTLGRKSWRFAHLTKAAQRAPSGYNRASPFHFNGKDYVGGQFIPGKAIEEASPQDRAKLQAAKEAEAKKAEASKAVRGATAVDPVALAHTLSQHAGAVELTKAERGNAARAYAALQRHHGDLTLHRIGELAARAEQAWRSVTDDDPNAEGLRSYWTRQLAAMAGWVERAKGAGLTGEAKGKPADAKTEEVREAAPAAGAASAPRSASNANGRVVIDRPASDDWEQATVTYRPSSGPLAGQELVHGLAETHPEHGAVVTFARHRNPAAFKAAKLASTINKVTLKTSDRPDLAELHTAAAAHRADWEARMAERNAAREKVRAAEQQQAITRMGEQLKELEAKVPADHVRINATSTGKTFDGTPELEYSLPDGTKLESADLHHIPGLVRHGWALAVMPGVGSAFDGTTVLLAPPAGVEALKAKKKAEQDARDSKRAERDAKRAAAQAEAARTGQPAFLHSHAESVDDERNENSLDIVETYIRADGTTFTRRKPTH